MGEYQAAAEYAKKAYSLGHPPKTLRERLIKKGYWKTDGEPEDATDPTKSTATQ